MHLQVQKCRRIRRKCVRATWDSWLTNTRDAQASLGVLRQMPPLLWLPIRICRPRCAAVTWFAFLLINLDHRHFAISPFVHHTLLIFRFCIFPFFFLLKPFQQSADDDHNQRMILSSSNFLTPFKNLASVANATAQLGAIASSFSTPTRTQPMPLLLTPSSQRQLHGVGATSSLTTSTTSEWVRKTSLDHFVI